MLIYIAWGFFAIRSTVEGNFRASVYRTGSIYGSHAFYYQNYDATLFVHGGSFDYYKNVENWKNFNLITEGVCGVESIATDGINVVAIGGAIEVSGADGERVEVYSGMETSISVAKGIYIVHFASTVHKMIL